MRKKEEILAKELGGYLKMREQDLPDRIHNSMQEYADEFACAFADYLVKNYQPRFPNKGEWVKIIDSNKFKRVYTTTELLEIFKKEQDGK
jgi:hypothetical protein